MSSTEFTKRYLAYCDETQTKCVKTPWSLKHTCIILIILKPHFYTVKLGFAGVYIILHISAQIIDCGYALEPPHWGGSNVYPQSMFWAEIWKISEFLSENFQFLVMKFSIYLNRRVFVMIKSIFGHMRPVKIQISRRIRKSDQNLHWVRLKAKDANVRTTQTLVRLYGWAGWFEILLGAHVRRYVFWRCGSNQPGIALPLVCSCLTGEW